jgi:hypothetical protein
MKPSNLNNDIMIPKSKILVLLNHCAINEHQEWIYEPLNMQDEKYITNQNQNLRIKSLEVEI